MQQSRARGAALTGMPDRREHVPGHAVREVDAKQLQLWECMAEGIPGAQQSAADEGQALYV